MILEPGHMASSIDWLTMTVKNRVQRDIIARMAEEETTRLEEAGHERVNYVSHGYSGWRAGGVTYGCRKDDDIVRLSGNAAGERWRTWGKHASNVSRIDLQVTHRIEGPPKSLGRTIYNGLAEGDIALRRARGQAIIESSDGGCTLYVGSRTSEVFLRLYDKGVEQAFCEPGLLWRWEVELKDASAKAMYQDLTRLGCSDMIIAGHVRRIWSERGITPPWKPTAETCAPYVTRPVTDVARKLSWLRNQVSPTVAYLIRRGLRADVLQALGVSEE